MFPCIQIRTESINKLVVYGVAVQIKICAAYSNVWNINVPGCWTPNVLPRTAADLYVCVCVRSDSRKYPRTDLASCYSAERYPDLQRQSCCSGLQSIAPRGHVIERTINLDTSCSWVIGWYPPNPHPQHRNPCMENSVAPEAIWT